MTPNDDLVRPYAPPAPAGTPDRTEDPAGAGLPDNARLFADGPVSPGRRAGAEARPERRARRAAPVALGVLTLLVGTGLAVLLIPGEGAPQAQPTVGGPGPTTTDALPPGGDATTAGPAGPSQSAGTRTAASAGAGTSAPAVRGAPAASADGAASAFPAATGRGGTGESATAGAPAVLRRGDSGPEVVRLQQLLHGQGFTYVSTTGLYDAATVRGVRQLQRDRGLTGDPAGVYGSVTRSALEG